VTESPASRQGFAGAPGTLIRAVAFRPKFWLVALTAVLRLARPRWWRRWPLLPLPDPSYWRFRLVTAYGGVGDAAPSADDALAYLRWCQRMRALRG